MALKLSKEKTQKLDAFDKERRENGLFLARAMADGNLVKIKKELIETTKELEQRAERTSLDQSLQGIFVKLCAPEQKAVVQKAIDSNSLETKKDLLALLAEPLMVASIRAQYTTEPRMKVAAAQMAREPTEERNMRQILRELRHAQKLGVEQISHRLQLVGRGGHKYCTPHTVTLRMNQEQRWKDYFKEQPKLTIGGRNEIGCAELNMCDLIENASANKFNEMYVLTKGLEDTAKRLGMTWAFITLSVPGRMHPNPKNGNKHWDGTTPKQAHDWIASRFKSVYNNLRSTHGIILSGVRVAEAQQDGTPHWHIIVFAFPNEMETIENEFRKKEKCWKSEAGCKFMVGHDGDGCSTAASYITKYLQKTTRKDGEHSEEADGNIAWRSAWQINAFRFFGIPPTSLWKNIRALPNQPTENKLLADLWAAAKNNDASTFIRLAGGIGIKDKNRPLKSRKISEKGCSFKTYEFEIKETGKVFSFIIEKWMAKGSDQVEDEFVEETTSNTSTQNFREVLEANNDGILVNDLSYPRKATAKPTDEKTTSTTVRETQNLPFSPRISDTELAGMNMVERIRYRNAWHNSKNPVLPTNERNRFAQTLTDIRQTADQRREQLDYQIAQTRAAFIERHSLH